MINLVQGGRTPCRNCKSDNVSLVQDIFRGDGCWRIICNDCWTHTSLHRDILDTIADWNRKDGEDTWQ